MAFAGNCRTDGEYPMPISITELMSNMPQAFIPESAQGMDAVIQFMFMGEESGEWFAIIKDGK